VVAVHGVSVALAYRTFQISETYYRYSPTLSSENEEIADWLERLIANKSTWGFGLCFLYLRNVQGYGWNHKRVYRIYCELELNLRIKPKKRLKRDKQNRWLCLTSGVVTLTRPVCKFGCRLDIKRRLLRISTPRMLRADDSVW